MGMTMVQKILAKATGQASVKVNDVVEPKVSLAMSHENGALVNNQFSEIYQGTGIETAAQRDLKQIRDAMSRWEEAKSELSHAKLLACVESDPMYVEMEL